jgi:hypothetical protein
VKIYLSLFLVAGGSHQKYHNTFAEKLFFEPDQKNTPVPAKMSQYQCCQVAVVMAFE